MTSFWVASHSRRLAYGASPGLWDHLLCSPLHPPHKPPIPTPAAMDCSQGIVCSPTTHFCSCSSLGPEYPSLLSLHCPHQILTNTISFLGPSLRNQGPGFLLCVVTYFFRFKASGIICIYVALPSLSLLPYLAGTPLGAQCVCECDQGCVHTSEACRRAAVAAGAGQGCIPAVTISPAHDSVPRALGATEKLLSRGSGFSPLAEMRYE